MGGCETKKGGKQTCKSSSSRVGKIDGSFNRKCERTVRCQTLLHLEREETRFEKRTSTKRKNTSILGGPGECQQKGKPNRETDQSVFLKR